MNMSTNPKPKILDVTPADEVEIPKLVETPKIAEAPKTVEATVANMKEGIAKATAGLEATQSKMTAGFEATQSKMKEGVEKAMKTAEELVAFNQGNIEALVKASQIWASGMQDLSKHLAATAQSTLDESMSALKAMTSVKSLKDAFDLQSSFARSALEKSLAESGKLTDASFKLTEQALAPITARVTVAVEKFAKAA
jgi:phasin family protein